MSIFTEDRDAVEAPFEHAWATIKHVFVADVQPEIKSFLLLFATQEGKLILTTAIAVAPGLVTGNFAVVAAGVAATVISQSKVIAKQDFGITLQQVQSALQVAKAAANIQTPGDAPTIAAIQAAVGAAPAAQAVEAAANAEVDTVAAKVETETPAAPNA